MVLVWLDKIEVSTFALREAVLTVKLKFGSNDWVLTPAVHVEGSLGEDKDTSIRDTVSSASSGIKTRNIARDGFVSLECGSAITTTLCGGVGEKTSSSINYTSSLTLVTGTVSED